MSEYNKGSLTLSGAVALGTGVMIGAGIFALLGQVAQFSGSLFPYAFIVGAIISGFSAYSYIKVSNKYPSAGGIAMILEKAYGKTTITAAAALLMAFSMIINESLVARTFGTYSLELFDIGDKTIWVPALGVGLLIIAFIINILGNKVIGNSSMAMAIIKIGGIVIFAIGGLWVANVTKSDFLPRIEQQALGIVDYLGALALSILAYKGFTTITNSGGEVENPHKNVGRAIVISILICLVVYLLVSFAVASNLSISEIIKAKDYALAEAARPAFGQYGLWFTVGIAIVATVSGIIASVFAVSRMTAMLTDMKLIPHSHLGMSGSIQKHMLVYIVVIAILLTLFFDLSRIAALGAIFYLIMDIIIHWGVYRHLKNEVGANSLVLFTAMALDAVVLGAFVWVKTTEDPLVIIVAGILITIIFTAEYWYIKNNDFKNEEE